MVRDGDVASLDGFRAVAILVVFLAHAPIPYSVPGGFGVTLFFFLSGYLITTLMLREHMRTGRIALSAFFQRRAIRLFPPILATLIVAVLVFTAGLVPGDGDLWAVPAQLLFYFNYYLTDFYGGTTVAGLGVLWSLSVEMHFYLLWPFVFLTLIRRRTMAGHVLLLLTMVLIWRTIRVYVFDTHDWAVMLSTDTRLDSLLWGCLLALLMRPGMLLASTVIRPWQAYLLLMVSGMLLVFAGFGIQDPRLQASLQYTLEGIALLPIFFLAVRYSKLWVFRPLNWRPVRTVGHWSYAIYLGHYVIIESLLAQAEANGLVIGASTVSTLIFVFIAGVITIIWGWAVNRLIERPLQPLRTRLHRAHSALS